MANREQRAEHDREATSSPNECDTTKAPGVCKHCGSVDGRVACALHIISAETRLKSVCLRRYDFLRRVSRGGTRRGDRRSDTHTRPFFVAKVYTIKYITSFSHLQLWQCTAHITLYTVNASSARVTIEHREMSRANDGPLIRENSTAWRNTGSGRGGWRKGVQHPMETYLVALSRSCCTPLTSTLHIVLDI